MQGDFLPSSPLDCIPDAGGEAGAFIARGASASLPQRGASLKVKLHPSKLAIGVRFPGTARGDSGKKRNNLQMHVHWLQESQEMGVV